MSRVRRRRDRARYGEHLTPSARFDLVPGSAAIPAEGTSLWDGPAEREAAWSASRDYLIAQSDDLTRLEGFWQYEPAIPDELRRKIFGISTPTTVLVAGTMTPAVWRAHMATLREWLRQNGWSDIVNLFARLSRGKGGSGLGAHFGGIVASRGL